ncbi:MAG: ATP-binding cassette domain-containing protein [Clostridia bacterium]|nr:ATP-binding cassette domain-containing protein [Clostridia bacterium]MBR3714845.1 ATP-binding cassette domain-containing protein [Clostridia bacterium]
MIQIENLVKKYGDKTAVGGITFSVEEGEIVGFLGPNGAGKTTTMSIITGCLSATSGKALINGIDILENPIEAKKNIGYLPELPPLYLEMTVKEYLNFVYDMRGCKLDREKHLKEICDTVKITDVANRVIRNLSKGYRQRVGIAQALINNPKVIIFDEPTVGLDPKQIIEIRNLIKTLGKNHTVILSTHILPEVQAVCDRIVIINKGKIVANEKTENISKIVDGNRRLNVKICGPQKDVLALIKSLPGVSYVDVLGSHELDSTSYLVESEPGIDIRKTLFNALASRGWAIIGIEALGLNLEDIFIAVVDTPESDKKQKKSKSKKMTLGKGKKIEIDLATGNSENK